MTREELKEHCEKQIEMCEFWAIGKGEKPSGKVYEEHKLILELLEKEPCNDAISRQAVLDLINDQKDAFYSNGDKCLFELYVNELPSATPKQKYGKWIYDRTRDWDGECKYECSECGMGSDVDYAYCMRCGAKMWAESEK